MKYITRRLVIERRDVGHVHQTGLLGRERVVAQHAVPQVRLERAHLAHELLQAEGVHLAIDDCERINLREQRRLEVVVVAMALRVVCPMDEANRLVQRRASIGAACAAELSKAPLRTRSTDQRVHQAIALMVEVDAAHELELGLHIKHRLIKRRIMLEDIVTPIVRRRSHDVPRLHVLRLVASKVFPRAGGSSEVLHPYREPL